MFDFFKTISTLTIASVSMSFVLSFAAPSQVFAQDFFNDGGAPFRTPVCDAVMVAEHGPQMNKEQYEEVVNWIQSIGGISADYAKTLRDLISEFYQTTPADVPAWVKKHCGDAKVKKYGPKV